MSDPDRARFETNMLQFIRSELETGMTFASLALGDQSGDKRERNRQNARKAYDTAKHFLEEHATQEIVAKPDLREGLGKLRDLLVELGEKF